MDAKLQTPVGKAVYALRKCVVAPVSAIGSGTGNVWPGHSIKDVGCILAGHGAGRLPKTGRQIRYKDGTSLGNLWLALAQMHGVECKQFGRSTAALTGLG